MKWKLIAIAGAFALAMGYLESAVVVYIRALYYPDGFTFPLIMPDRLIFITELFREAATIIMIITASMLCARKVIERFAFFIYIFAVWDIFYYVFLKVILDWPAGLFDWDVLFFIPLTWTGPVIAPLINSFCMILLAMIILYLSAKHKKVKTGIQVWSLLVSGSLLVIYAYLLDYAVFITSKFSFSEIFTVSVSDEVLEYASGYIPSTFNYWIFATGVAMHIAAMFVIFIRNAEKK
jgi:hypothetical protein